MKKNLYYVMTLMLVCLLALGGCGSPAQETAVPQTEAPAQNSLSGLTGHWDLYGFEENGELTGAGYLYENTVGMNLHIGEDGSGWWYNGMEIHEVTLDFSEKDDTLTATFPEDGSRMTFSYDPSAGQILLELEAGTVVLARNPGLSEAVAGSWAGMKNGRLYTLELNRDRSFTLSGDTPAEGTWHLRPFTAINGRWYAGLDLMYAQNGETVIRSFSLPAGKEENPPDISLLTPELTLQTGDGDVGLRRKDPADLQQLRTLLDEDLSLLPGHWTSTAVYTRDSVTAVTTQTLTLEYTLTFAEDGSFTGSLNRERSGSWCFDALDVTDGVPTYSYLLTFDDGTETVQCTVTAGEGDPQLSILEPREVNPRSAGFRKLAPEDLKALTEAADEAETKLAGSWTTGSTRFQDGDGPVVNEINTGYTVSFRNDGTFTTNIAQGTAGSWSVSEVTPLDQYGTTLYTYNFRPDGFDGVVSCTCLEDSLSIMLYSDGLRYQYNFGRYNGAELANIRNVPTRLEGTWHSEDVFRLNRDTGRFEFLRREDHTVTLTADGAFRSTLEGEETGSWFFSHYTPGYGYCFLPGDPDSSISTMDMMETGTLDIALEQDGEIYAISMTKE